MRVLLAYVACFLLWGSTWLFIKLGLRDLPPLLFAGTRMALAGAILTPFALRSALRLERKAALELAGIGVLQIALPYGLSFVAQQWIPSAVAAVLFASFPVWIVLVGHFLLPDHPLTLGKLLAAALGLGGVVILELPALRSALPGAGASLQGHALLGGLCMVTSALLAALANVLIRRTLGTLTPLVMAWGQIWSGAVCLLLLAALLERDSPAHWTPRAFLILGYLSVLCTAVCYLLLFWLLPRIPMAAIGTIPLLDTTVAVILGTLVLHERAGLTLLFGGAMVLVSAAFANLGGRRARASLADADAAPFVP